ncbi:MAG: ABC transporter permease [Acidimicrobiia bacterium]
MLDRTWPPVLVLVATVVIWQGVVDLFDVKPYLVPAPSRVWDAFWATKALLPAHIRATTTTAVLGLGLGVVVAAVLAIAVASVSLLRRGLYPLLVAAQSIPTVVLAPVLIVGFGFGQLPRVIVVALVAFFPVVVSSVDGLLGADRDLTDLVRSMGAGRRVQLARVAIPSALPGFFAGTKIAASYAMFGAVVAEWIGASEGLGIYFERSRHSSRTDQVFVAVVLIALVSVALFAAVGLLSRVAMPWRVNQEETR